MSTDNGIYYFLGNITSHILHALPLYKKLGGTFVVTSNKARKKIEQLYDVPVINVDNRPYKLMKPGRRPKLIHEYITLDKHLKNTYDFLNKNAQVIIFYELFELEKPEWIKNPKKVFLTHGNMLKSYMTMYPKRLEIIKDYDYMAALGPHMKQQFIKDGINPTQLLDIGVARTDEVVKHSGEILISQSLRELVGKENVNKPIVSYMPTFWGASSIYSTGLEIINNTPEEYTLLFRPHPQTPRKILMKYHKILMSRANVIYLPEGRYKDISLIDIFNASSVIIGDASSVMLEAILIKKPIIFAYDTTSDQQQADYQAIANVVKYSQSVNVSNAVSLAEILNNAVVNGVNSTIWNKAIVSNFFDYSGESVDSIIENINRIKNEN